MEQVQKIFASMKLEEVAQRDEKMLSTVPEDCTVESALQVLRDKQILSVPVVSASGHFSGCFSVTDALKALIRGLKLDKQRSSLDLKPGDAGRALAKVYDSTVAQVMHDGDLWYMQGQQVTVLDAVWDMCRRSQVHHRLFTCATLRETRPTGLLSQSDAVRLLWDHRGELGALRNKSIEDLGLCAAAADTVPATETALYALVALWRDHHTSMGVTAADGALVATISISDLRALPRRHFGLLDAPVAALVLAARGHTVPDVRPLTGDGVDWDAQLRDKIVVHTVTPQATFGDVLNALSAHRLHRLYVLDSVEKSVGIVTLTDVLRVVLGDAAPEPGDGPAGGLPASTELDGAGGSGVAQGGGGAGGFVQPGSHQIDVET